MSEVLGVDYSYGRPGGAALAAAGKRYAARYLEYNHAPNDGKFIHPPEVADLHNHGIAIVANFESTATRALGGRNAGIQDGYDALVSLGALNAPVDLPVYFSIDFDALLAHQPIINAYLSGAGSVLGLARIGVYGGLGVVSRCKANRTASWFWQAAGWGGSPRCF